MKGKLVYVDAGGRHDIRWIRPADPSGTVFFVTLDDTGKTVEVNEEGDLEVAEGDES